MGDRVSISFVDYNKDGTVFDESVALFAQWGGPEFVEIASEYVKKGCFPGEPCFTMTAFIRSLDSSIDTYLGRDGRDGDNSDNGHWRISLLDGSTQRVDLDKEEERLIDDLKQENTALKAQLDRVTSRLERIVQDLVAGRGG